MGVFLKVLGEDLRSMVPWVLWITVSFAVAITGPFGSYGPFDLSDRALFWTPVIGLSILIASVIRAVVVGDTHQPAHTRPDGAHRLVAHGDARRPNSLHQSTHDERA